MPGALYNRLADLAAENYGYLTTEEVEEAGIDPHRLLELARRGQLEHRARALYRLPLIPPTPLDAYREATLWPRGAEGVISHATALPSLEEARLATERRHILRALALTGGEIIPAAKALGVSRTTLWEKMRRLGIANPST